MVSFSKNILTTEDVHTYKSAWCKTQVQYGILSKRYLPPHQRPKSIKTSKGKPIKINPDLMISCQKVLDGGIAVEFLSIIFIQKNNPKAHDSFFDIYFQRFIQSWRKRLHQRKLRFKWLILLIHGASSEFFSFCLLEQKITYLSLSSFRILNSIINSISLQTTGLTVYYPSAIFSTSQKQ